MAQDLVEAPQVLAELRRENGLLRAQVASLHERLSLLQEELSLRDHALDATPTLFLIAKYGARDPTVVYCNRIVADQHGTSRDALIGTSVNLLTQWRANSADTETVEATLRAGEMFRYEGEVTRCDGSTFWLGMTVRPLFDSAGRLSHSVSIGADITAKRDEDRKKSELQTEFMDEVDEREQAALELEEAQKLASMGRLASGIAHQIHTPLQYVNDSLQFLRTGYYSMSRMLETWRARVAAFDDPGSIDELRAQLAAIEGQENLDLVRDEASNAFERILDGVTRMSVIVDALKDFAQPPTQGQAPVDVNDALRTTLIVAANEYKYSATIRTELGELPLITANGGELQQVFLCLIVNAARAVQESAEAGRGEIRIATRFAAGVVTVTIGGNGPSAIGAALVLDGRFAAKGPERALAAARAIIVDRHGGDLTLDSTAGAGTTYMVRLPAGGHAVRAHDELPKNPSLAIV